MRSLPRRSSSLVTAVASSVASYEPREEEEAREVCETSDTKTCLQNPRPLPSSGIILVFFCLYFVAIILVVIDVVVWWWLTGIIRILW